MTQVRALFESVLCRRGKTSIQKPIAAHGGLRVQRSLEEFKGVRSTEYYRPQELRNKNYGNEEQAKSIREALNATLLVALEEPRTDPHRLPELRACFPTSHNSRAHRSLAVAECDLPSLVRIGVSCRTKAFPEMNHKGARLFGKDITEYQQVLIALPH